MEKLTILATLSRVYLFRGFWGPDICSANVSVWVIKGVLPISSFTCVVLPLGECLGDDAPPERSELGHISSASLGKKANT
eukprot:5460055-Amphidinium_carterae.1